MDGARQQPCLNVLKSFRGSCFAAASVRFLTLLHHYSSWDDEMNGLFALMY